MLAAVYPYPRARRARPAPPPPMAKLSLPSSRPFAGGQFKPKRAEGGVLGWRAGGTRCRQKTAAVRGRDPPLLGRGFGEAPPPPAHRPRPQRTRLGPGARRCRPRVPLLGCVRLPSPPSTAARHRRFAPLPPRRGLFAPVQLLLQPGAAARAALRAPAPGFLAFPRLIGACTLAVSARFEPARACSLTQKVIPRAF